MIIYIVLYKMGKETKKAKIKRTYVRCTCTHETWCPGCIKKKEKEKKRKKTKKEIEKKLNGISI